MSDEWREVKRAFKLLADTLEAQGDTATMSECWAPINMIDHDRDIENIGRRLRAIARAVTALNDKLSTES